MPRFRSKPLRRRGRETVSGVATSGTAPSSADAPASGQASRGYASITPKSVAPDPIVATSESGENGEPSLRLAHSILESELKCQDGTVTSIRNRATTVFTVAALVATLSTTLGFSTSENGRPLPEWTPWVLLGILATTGIFTIVTLWPIKPWYYTPSTRIITNRARKSTAIDDILLDSIESMRERVKSNTKAINRCSLFLRIAFSLLIAEIIALTIGIGLR